MILNGIRKEHTTENTGTNTEASTQRHATHAHAALLGRLLLVALLVALLRVALLGVTTAIAALLGVAAAAVTLVVATLLGVATSILGASLVVASLLRVAATAVALVVATLLGIPALLLTVAAAVLATALLLVVAAAVLVAAVVIVVLLAQQLAQQTTLAAGTLTRRQLRGELATTTTGGRADAAASATATCILLGLQAAGHGCVVLVLGAAGAGAIWRGRVASVVVAAALFILRPLGVLGSVGLAAGGLIGRRTVGLVAASAGGWGCWALPLGLFCVDVDVEPGSGEFRLDVIAHFCCSRSHLLREVLEIVVFAVVCLPFLVLLVPASCPAWRHLGSLGRRRAKRSRKVRHGLCLRYLQALFCTDFYETVSLLMCRWFQRGQTPRKDPAWYQSARGVAV